MSGSVESEVSSEQVYSYPDLPQSFAALGTAERVATIAQISARTSFSITHSADLAEKMVSLGRVNRAGNRYRPSQDFIHLFNLNETKMFQQHFLSTAEKVVLEAEKSMNQSSANPNANVYFISAFSVPESKRPELKVEFRELLVRFMKANEQPCSNHFYFLSHSF